MIEIIIYKKIQLMAYEFIQKIEAG